MSDGNINEVNQEDSFSNHDEEARNKRAKSRSTVSHRSKKSQPTLEPKKSDLDQFRFLFSEEELVTEEIVESTESENTPLDREQYYEKYLILIQDYGFIKRINNFLHKKMGDYFSKRKMDHVLLELDLTNEAQIKYGARLDNFAELVELDNKQRDKINQEIAMMNSTKKDQYNLSENEFKNLIAREKEIGIGLISEKTGKEISEKYVEKLLNNQKHKARELQTIRLLHIKIQNAVKDANDAIQKIDRISEKYSLMEFEQLKIENQGHSDKIEDRDEELTKLRKRCAGAIQCLAHVREKAAALENVIRTSKQKFDDKVLDCTVAREEVNRLKQLRDFYRNEAQKLKRDNEFITKDKLLINMEECINKNEKVENYVKELKKNLVDLQSKLDAIRSNYEKLKRRSHRKKSLPGKEGTKVVERTCRKPSILKPIFEPKA